MLITFSGLDGSGKSTLILRLREILEKEGFHASVRTMYFHISLYAQIRAMRDKLFAKKYGQREKKSSRYNLIPNLRKPDVSDKATLQAQFVYGFFRSRFLRRLSFFGDLVIFWFCRLWVESIKGHVLITDRYFYDSLADVVSQKKPRWFFVRFFIKICPRPDLPVFVDVPPEIAFERKGEYPIDYMKWRRETYQSIFEQVGNPFILDNKNLEEAASCLGDEALRRISQ